MLGPQHADFLIRFFDGIDAKLSERLVRRHPPDESALTNEFCALMDAETQEKEKLLAYSLDQLNEDLKSLGDDTHFSFKIDTRPHNSKMESRISQSDLGLIVEYTNHLMPSLSGFWVYLLQAKRLFRNDRTGEYDEHSQFQSADAEQHSRINALAGIVGAKFLRYFLYCPPVEQFSEHTKVKIRALHNAVTSRNIFDYAAGLSLFDYLRQRSGKFDAGSWVCPIDIKPSSVLRVHEAAFTPNLPLTWFILRHFLAFSGESPMPASYKGSGRSEQGMVDWVRRIAEGDQDAIERIYSQAHEAALDGGPGYIRILPKHTMTIGVTVGGSLPAESRRIASG